MIKQIKKNKTKDTSQNKIVNGKLLSAEWVASPNYNQRPVAKQDNQQNQQDVIDDCSKTAQMQAVVDTVVMHNISLPPNEFGRTDTKGIHYVQAFFTNSLDWEAHPYFQTIKGIEVSAHLFIQRTGKIIQFVNFNDRAWHAGKSSYLGREAVNDFSIGIEMEGSDFQPFTDAQYAALADTVVAIYEAYPKTRRQLTGHSDIAPVRKTDPGEFFEWRRLRKMISERITADRAHA